jgi:beta-lactamase superfamily II metal-dependent hydrolase
MLCEIEFLPVGEGSRAGDAIVVRYGTLERSQLLVVDGGTADTGERLVAHLRGQFGPAVYVDDVVLTHSDIDHASGLRELIREIPVGRLWLHMPWVLGIDAKRYFRRKDYTDQGLTAAIKKEYDIVAELVDVAQSRGVTILSPFQGANIGPFTVLSPKKETYLRLLPQFDKTPEADQTLLEAERVWIGKAPTGIVRTLLDAARATVANWWPETWDGERLKDGGQTSASNESSVILYGDFGNGRRALLTGDAGINALSWAVQYANTKALVLQNFSFIQIPHHGSRSNVGPSVLNALIGAIVPRGVEPRFAAFVSAPKDDASHPRKIVLNAFMRRGGIVVATQGDNKVHLGGFPLRPGYGPVQPIEFSTFVEAYD